MRKDQILEEPLTASDAADVDSIAPARMLKCDPLSPPSLVPTQLASAKSHPSEQDDVQDMHFLPSETTEQQANSLLTDRMVSKQWKVRLQAYKDAKMMMQKTQDGDRSIITIIEPLLVGAAGDGNASANDSAVEMIEAWCVEHFFVMIPMYI